MDDKTCYEWGNLFASPWDEIVEGMNCRATQVGLVQVAKDHCLTWMKGDEARVRYLFVDDPSDVDAVRRIFNDASNINTPVVFIVVRQPDPTDTRGDIIFDIFRLSPESYLWHFTRVYTPPIGKRT